MNYPLRNAILRFFQQGDGEGFVRSMEIIRENYPPFAFYSAMNSLGTHDVPRALTLLAVGSEQRDQSKQWRAEFRLSPKQKRRGVELLNSLAARSGPMVWEEEGPLPILYISRMDFMEIPPMPFFCPIIAKSQQENNSARLTLYPEKTII